MSLSQRFQSKYHILQNSILIIIARMDKYRIKRTLGDGTFGVVFEAASPSNEIVAIKKMKQKYASMDDVLNLRQIKSLRKFDHHNIVKLKEVILANSELFLVFEYLETNLLQVYTRAQEACRKLTEPEIKKIFFQMTQGLAYLHKKGYFHRDLKPQNVLCHNHEVKLCDLGLARQIRSRPPFTEYVSTRWYRAPELLLRSNTYNSPVDIFALACIIIELFLMEPLFPGNNEIDSMNKIVELLGTPKKSEWPQGFKLASSIHYNFPQCKGISLIDKIPNASFDIIQLLQLMLNYSSRKRPSANDILKHSYFQNYSLANFEQKDKKQPKFSFYDKPIIEIPKNVKIENSKQVNLRKSMIKFGDSFTSTFGKKSSQKQEQSKKNEKKMQGDNNLSRKNKYLEEEDHDISKKFDEMQEILQELKKKQQNKVSATNLNSKNPKANEPAQKSMTQEQEELRLRMFSLESVGTRSMNAIKLMPNINQKII